jgi:hypothetical protein
MERDVAALAAGKRWRLKHRCGHFLAELRDGMLYVACGRCKELVPVLVDPPATDLRERRRRVCPRSPRGA